MPEFQFQSNMSVILLIIVIALVSLYFYLELKKVKLVNEELDKKNEMIIKEIDNIHLRLHKFFSGMPKSIVPQPKMSSKPKTPEEVKSNNPKVIESNNNSKNDSNVSKMSSLTKNTNNEINKETNDTNDTNDTNEQISVNDFNNLKKNHSNNIFGEIEEIVNDNDDDKLKEDIIEEHKPFIVPDLEPVIYEPDKNIDSNSEENIEEEDDEVEDITDIGGSDNENISDDLDEDLLDKYMKMSVKELKDICSEKNLKHSGNKTALAKRIVENLE